MMFVLQGRPFVKRQQKFAESEVTATPDAPGDETLFAALSGVCNLCIASTH
jgi:hypothetical protein